MKLVGCRHCGNLVGSTERRCPFCGGALAAETRLGFAACAVLAGLVLGGCASKADTPFEGESEGESDTDGNGPSSSPNGNPPSGEATYGVPVTDSDWFGTETEGWSSSGDLPETDTDGDTDVSDDTDSETDTDTDAAASDTDGDTDAPSSDTDAPSSDTEAPPGDTASSG